MKITEIEVHHITLEYVDWLADSLMHYYGPAKRTVYIVHTDSGLEGLGEGSAEPEETIERYFGTDPFNWIGDDTSLPLAMAMYDLMGKHLGQPVYKLIGPKYRSWIPSGSWTVSTAPRKMAQAVVEYSRQGYTWMKYHLSPFENVIDQTKAMQEVAPPGFKIHYDFTMGGTTDHMAGLLEELARFPIAGCFEDPLEPNDIDGYIALRQRSPLPIVLHHCPFGATSEVLMRVADAYMLGHARIGTAIRRAGLFEAAGVPFSVQNVGGNITRAMTIHLQAACPTGSFHFFSDAETWKSDVVREHFEPINGCVPVSERHGLGVTLDRAELERLEYVQSPEQEPFLLKSTFRNGVRQYCLHDPRDPIFMVRPDRRRLLPMSYVSPITTDYWDDDGSSAFREMLERARREGVVMERDEGSER